MVYRAVVVPRLWELTHSVHSRVYTDNTIVEIIEAVLKHNGLASRDYALRLKQRYPKREHVCQYKETDYGFISRWMEREGMYFFFEHGEDADKLVITDGLSGHELSRQAPVRYTGRLGGDVTALEAFSHFRCTSSALPQTVLLKDYDYLNPRLEVSGSAEVSSNGRGVISLYGQNFATPDEGGRYSRVRAEELKARQRVFHGQGRVFHLRPGYRFKLEEHPQPALNQSYLAVAIEHYGNQTTESPELLALLGLDDTDEYRAEATAIRADVQYRAPFRHAWPRIEGYEHATVSGPADSPYAQVDEHGRYKLRIHFDESDLVDGSATTWVRMMQPHSGVNEGFHFPLRKGTEALVFFLAGDPDRPVIAGVVPNAITPSKVTSANNTMNVLQSGGLNRMEMRDDAGLQHIKLKSPPENTYIHLGAPNSTHNVHMCTDGDSLTRSGRNWDVEIGANLTEEVGGNVTETYGANKNTTVAANETISVGANQVLGVKGTQTITVDGPVTIDYNATLDTTVEGNETHTTMANLEQTVMGTFDQTVDGNVTQTFNSSHVLEVTGGTQDITVSGNIKILSSGGTVHVESPSTITLKAPTVDIQADSSWLSTTISDAELFVNKNAAGAVLLEARGFQGELNGAKVEAGGFARIFYASINQAAAIEVYDVAVHQELHLTRIENHVTNIGVGALFICNHGFTKI
jgi:type VI secretion system secreted protein VgrG